MENNASVSPFTVSLEPGAHPEEKKSSLRLCAPSILGSLLGKMQ
jgi:hypothetical protein